MKAFGLLVGAALVLAAAPAEARGGLARMLAPGSGARADNPFFQEWKTPFGAPPFARIRPEHFGPAFRRALAEERAELDAIAHDPARPSFANTIEALERSGQRLKQVNAVFSTLTSSRTDKRLSAIEREMAPRLAENRSRIFLNEALFARVEQLYRERGRLGLTPEQARVLERYDVLFHRAGAGLDEASRRRLAEIGQRISTLETQFSQNVLADETSYTLRLTREDDLAGLPESVRQEAARAATEHGLEGYAITLARSSIEPFLQFSERRDLRQAAYEAWIARGDSGGATDNKAIVAELLRLRAEEARLLGFPSFAHFRLADRMAKTPDAALALLHRVWAPALCRARAERDELQALAEADGVRLAPWDWRYYAQRLRKTRRGFDEAEIKPYLQLDRMVEAAFDTAHRLFGLTFRERHDVPVYHPDVRVWEVRRADGRVAGLFYGDYFARPGKGGGSWMSAIRDPEKLTGQVPIVLNAMNFAKGAPGQPVLLTFEDANSLFHEFGHALHALLSDITYPLIAGTNVATDFAEFPAQLYEHWLERPEVLRRFAMNVRTGLAMPKALIDRMLAARQDGQGFETVQYLASAFVDLEAHLIPSAEGFDAGRFEQMTLSRLGLPPEVGVLHRLVHFTHIFGDDGGYAAGYYGYLWAEVLDTDGFRAFEEAGDAFDPVLASRLERFVYSAGALRDPAEAYAGFRGRPPSVDALLHKRGFTDGGCRTPAASPPRAAVDRSHDARPAAPGRSGRTGS